MNNEHKIKIESRDLPFMQDGYRCSCGEGMVADSMHKARRIHDERLIEQAQDKTDNKYTEKVENGFYETFKKELPQFHSDNAVSYVVGECMRAAKRAEMKVYKELNRK